MAGAVVITDDNVKEVLLSLSDAKEITLAEIGLAVVSHTREGTPVRTGVLRDAWASEVRPDESAVYIGDLISKYPAGKEPYGKYVELGARGTAPRNMLSNGVTEHIDEYKKIAVDKMKNA